MNAINNCPECGRLGFRQNEKWATDGREGANPTVEILGVTVHRCCAHRVEFLVNDFDERAYVAAGVWRWRSNDNCVPDDAMLVLLAMGMVSSVQVEATSAACAADTAAFIKRYREQARVPSGEALMEMRNEFGEGVEMVDIVSGVRWTT